MPPGGPDGSPPPILDDRDAPTRTRSAGLEARVSMTEHLIRLRGAWEFQTSDGPRRVDLPTTWPPGAPAPLLLARRFNRPRVDAGRETIGLLLEDVPGLLSVRLNDREVARPGPGSGTLEVPVEGMLTPKNLLVLEVDPAGVRAEPWGRIALVIRGV